MEPLLVRALRGEEMERVPVAPLVTLGHAARASGIEPAEYVLDNRSYADAQLYAKKLHGHDWAFAHQPFMGITKGEKKGAVREGDAKVLTLELGARLKLAGGRQPQITEPAAERLGVDNLEVPDPYKKERQEPIGRMLAGCECVFGMVRGPFTFASTFLYGLEGFLVALKRDTELVRKLLDFSLEYALEYASAQVGAGVHGIFIADASASPEVISPADYRRFALPYEKKLLERIDAPKVLHICGDITPIIDDIAALDIDCLSLDQVMDMRELHERFTVWGNVAPDLLVNGAPEEVREAAEGVVALKDRVVLSSGCVVPANAKGENLKAMVGVSHAPVR